MTVPQVLLHETPARSTRGARRFVDTLSAVAARGRRYVALSDGSAPRILYDLRAAPK
jgi:hypothetical protein